MTSRNMQGRGISHYAIRETHTGGGTSLFNYVNKQLFSAIGKAG